MSEQINETHPSFQSTPEFQAIYQKYAKKEISKEEMISEAKEAAVVWAASFDPSPIKKG